MEDLQRVPIDNYSSDDSSSSKSSSASENEITADDDCRELRVDAILSKKLHPFTNVTVGESIYEILHFYYCNATTKKALYDALSLTHFHLPKPNNLPKNRYFLLKLIDSLLPNDTDLISKHRLCEDCGDNLGKWNDKTTVVRCANCKSHHVKGNFVTYGLESSLKHALENRNLKELLKEFNSKNTYEQNNIVSHFNLGVKYQNLKKETINNDFDICLLWNTDGTPYSHSSKGQIWLVQALVLNIPPEYRKEFKFCCGIYYSTVKKPCLTSFLWPFAKYLKALNEKKLKWYDKEEKCVRSSNVVAPIATLDAPAKGAAQNIGQFNSDYGCSECEIKGENVEKGRGHVHVYPMDSLNDLPTMRTKARMYAQALRVLDENLEHVNGVRGPSVASAIPHFDVAESFGAELLHVNLGVARMLFNFFFNSKNHRMPYYVSKKHKDEINVELQKVSPPNYVTRTPKTIKDINFWKGSEIFECLIHYFPIFLKGRLKDEYYQHFLMFAYGTKILCQSEMNFREIEVANCLFKLFQFRFKALYGIENCTYLLHCIGHQPRMVLFWGPLTAWSTFPFEDTNGFIKRITHGSNKIDMEIANTLKLINAYEILKQKLNKNIDSTLSTNVTMGASQNVNLDENENLIIQRFCVLNSTQFCDVQIYCRVKIKNTIFTSGIYLREKKRNNSFVEMKDHSYAKILYFMTVNNSIFAVLKKLCIDPLVPKIQIPSLNVDFSIYIVPFRNTYCIDIVPVENIDHKIMVVKNYLCLPIKMYRQIV